jgi:membrane protein DedA with SNARE-associated domain
VTGWIARDGVYAVCALMALDAVVPLGGELTMLVAGVIAGGAITGAHASLLGAEIAPGLQGYVVLSLAGVLGSMVGGMLGWAIGARGGRPLIERHGRLLRVGPEELARAEAWFARFGDTAVLVGRLTPVVRSFIAIPAGALGSPLPRYTLLTLASALIWCFGFAAVGWALGTAWTSFHHDFRFVEVGALAATLALTLVAARRHARRDVGAR